MKKAALMFSMWIIFILGSCSERKDELPRCWDPEKLSPTKVAYGKFIMHFFPEEGASIFPLECDNKGGVAMRLPSKMIELLTKRHYESGKTLRESYVIYASGEIRSNSNYDRGIVFIAKDIKIINIIKY